MPFWTDPKGSIVHSLPDWYPDKLAVTYGQGSNLGKNGGVLLWNDSNPPVNFYVYKLLFGNNQVTYTFNISSVGQIMGVKFSGAFAVMQNRGAPPGTVYSFDGNVTVTGQGITTAFSLEQWKTVMLESHFPLWIVPPNQGLAVWSNNPAAASTDFFANFWYVAL